MYLVHLRPKRGLFIKRMGKNTPHDINCVVGHLQNNSLRKLVPFMSSQQFSNPSPCAVSNQLISNSNRLVVIVIVILLQ